jgi:SAM-dependent methyltransferase
VVRSFGADTKDSTVLGIGFAVPYLSSFLSDNSSVFACMPATQGVIHWPAQAANLSLLADETELPFADNSMQRVLVAHALENSENARKMMTEIWRVLSPTGRLLMVVPNRRGIWARSPQSPFAHGQPFTYWQLRQLLEKHSLTATGVRSALFFPPSTRKYILRFSAFMERIGNSFFPGFAGVIIIEAEKQIYAPALQKARVFARPGYLPVAQPV